MCGVALSVFRDCDDGRRADLVFLGGALVDQMLEQQAQRKAALLGVVPELADQLRQKMNP